MKRILMLVLIIFSNNLFAINEEEILNAMRDEINRSMEELKLDGLKRPYYIEYRLSIKDVNQIASKLGNTKSFDTNSYALLNVGLRVGDYKFDNTNFFDVGLSFFGSSDDEERFKNRRIPVDIDYNSLRRELWLATDAAYKQSAELLSKKEASIKNKTRVDTTSDFLRIPVNTYNMKTKHPDFDFNKYKNLTNKVSKVFREYPDIFISYAGIEFLPETIYYVNSEGIEYIKTEMMTGFEIVAYTQADDGMPVADFYTAYGKTPDDLPDEDSLLNAAKLVAETTVNLKKAEPLNDHYSGPILFTGKASAELFSQIFAPNLVTQRDVLTENGVQSEDRNKAFQMKIGGRVLPDFLSVKAIPNKDKYNETILLGNYQLDDSGVKPQDVLLVENGYLQALLSERIPTRRVKESNGHKFGGAAMYTNLHLFSSEDKIKTYDELKNKMIELCKARELEYGIVVKKIINQNLMVTTLFKESQGNYEIPRGSGNFAIAELYKVYPDGTEELIRGGSGKGFNHRSFRDVIAVGNQEYALNLLAPSVISPFISGGEQFVGASIISPDLLFEDGEIRMMDGTFIKPPILSNPLN